MGIRDEVAATPRDTRAGTCVVCSWLSGLPKREREEWQDVFLDKSFRHSQVIRVAKNHDVPASRSVIERHRQERHDAD